MDGAKDQQIINATVFVVGGGGGGGVGVFKMIASPVLMCQKSCKGKPEMEVRGCDNWK